jgi:hypothetical protein
VVRIVSNRCWAFAFLTSNFELQCQTDRVRRLIRFIGGFDTQILSILRKHIAAHGLHQGLSAVIILTLKAER